MAETALAPSKQQKLDDVMIAMDVVDMLRHREDLVRRGSTTMVASGS